MAQKINVLPWLSHTLTFCIASLLGSSATAEAATFARASAVAEFSNFASNTLVVSRHTSAFTEATARGDLVANANDAQSRFRVAPIGIQAFTEGVSEGFGRDFQGNTSGDTSVVGLFRVEEEFSFNFSAQLGVLTDVERSGQEASALADLSLSVFASETLDGPVTQIGSLRLAGFTSSVSDEDIFRLESSSNISLAPQNCSSSLETTCITQSFGGNKEFATALITGQFHQSFAKPTFVSLIESKVTATQVRVFEPTYGRSLLILGLFTIAARYCSKRPSVLKEVE